MVISGAYEQLYDGCIFRIKEEKNTCATGIPLGLWRFRRICVITRCVPHRSFIISHISPITILRKKDKDARFCCRAGRCGYVYIVCIVWTNGGIVCKTCEYHRRRHEPHAIQLQSYDWGVVITNNGSRKSEVESEERQTNNPGNARRGRERASHSGGAVPHALRGPH